VGWEPCWTGLYNGNEPLADILAACSGDRLMLGCRPVGDANLTLAAMAPRADVLYDCGSTQDCVHQANGVGWYYSDSHSWGFAPGGEAVSRTSCDTENTIPEERLCWHTQSNEIDGGWRCGATTGLNNDNSWERMIFQPGN
jgi:hypothetical protein